MKMNFKTMAIAAMAAVIGLSACSKEDGGSGGIDNGEPTSVSLKLSESPASRAVSAPAQEVEINFNTGYVLFTNSLGIINKVTEITTSEPGQADKDAGTKVGIATLKATDGAEIKNVPAAATKVYIAGNLPSGVATPALAENISAVEGSAIAIATQSNATGDVDDVTLWGDGMLTAHPSVTGAKYADVEVNAIAARIEIGKVSYSSTTNFVTGFQIDGIFVNYYYPKMSLASEVSTALVNNAPADNTEADLWYTMGSIKYGYVTELYDYDPNGLGYRVSNISFSAADPGVPTDENVWAYNVLAPKTYATPVTSLEAPHVVIRLSNITTTSDPQYTTTQYLTVREFRENGTTTVIDYFQPGYIYYITDLTFDESNLTNVPEAETVVVHVEAKLMTWARQEVDWGF